ncbi:MAG: hypothetical protein H8E30_11870, partial [Alphaproteobacteria bacterium]|nr:hypothetical protein [Alphaproteobacteria bacterium]
MTIVPTTDSAEIANELLKAESKFRVARLGAIVSVIGAILSFLATIYVGIQSRETDIAIARLKDETARGALAVQRADRFKELIQELTTGEETTAQLAFLNLWQLYPDPSERGLIILTALEKGGPSIVKTMTLLESEFTSHLNKIREAAKPTSCAETSQQDCTFTLNAKKLLLHIEPEETLDLLLAQLSSYPSKKEVTLEDPNIAFIIKILRYKRELSEHLETVYRTKYKDIHVLTYVLYSLGMKEYLRNIITDTTANKQAYVDLVSSILSVPLEELEVEDWQHLINATIATLRSEDGPRVKRKMLRLLDRARAQRVLNDSARGDLQDILVKLASSPRTEITVRDAAIGILTNLSLKVGIQT